MANNYQTVIEERRNEIRKLLISKVPKWILYETLKNHKVVIQKDEQQIKLQPYAYISYKTFQRDLEAIADEDHEYFIQMKAKTWDQQIRTSIEIIDNDQRELMNIAKNDMTGIREKIDALVKHAELETLIVSLILHGQTALAIRMRGVQSNGQELSNTKPMEEISR